jgi:proline dehydrogenase
MTSLPKPIVRLFAYKYVAGEDASEAINLVKKLNQKQFSVTLDILGEHEENKIITEKNSHDYINLLTQIHSNKLDCNLSIKPSHLGMDISHNCAINNIKSIISKAKQYKNFIRLDMEDSSQTESTIDLYKKLNETHGNLGIVFQAYLHRTKNDLIEITKTKKINFRLCKGIYKESPNVAIQGKKDINENFMELLEYAFANKVYVGIATHDNEILEKSYALIKKMNIKNNLFEFQVLYGVPMSGWLERHLAKNYKVRVYVPFGKDWYDYSMRRLKENPDIAKYILLDIFKK